VIELKKGLLTNKYTTVSFDEEDHGDGGFPYKYRISRSVDDKTLGNIIFQDGPVKEYGCNGLSNEDLLNIVIDRLEHFQVSEFNCRENALAITNIEQALLWLRKRTMERELRGVEGTSEV